MALKEIEFTSHDGRDQIQAWIYSPVQPPRGIIQIVHGLGEHSRRYLHMISHFLDQGFVVAADDHAGHGKTAVLSGVWGDTGPDGATSVIEDEAQLATLVRKQYPSLPLFLFGHSWGSMIARGYAVEHGGDLAGLALCGVAAQIQGIDNSFMDRAALQRRVNAGQGEVRDDGTLLGEIFDGFVSRYEDVSGPNDWLAVDRNVVRDHARDPLNNLTAPMSLRFINDFVSLYEQVNSTDFYERVRTDLPVLIVSGDMDPVANYGEGAYHVANQLAAHGSRDVHTRLWSGYRHEIHNDATIRDEVENEILDFVERHLATPQPDLT